MSRQNYTKVSSEDDEDHFYDAFSLPSPNKSYQYSEDNLYGSTHTHNHSSDHSQRHSYPASPLTPILSNCSPKVEPKKRRGSIARESYNYDDDDDDDDFDYEEEARIAKKYNTNLKDDKKKSKMSTFSLVLYIVLFVILVSLIFGIIALNLSPSFGCLGSPYIYISHQENILKFSRDGCILHKKVLWGSNKYVENKDNGINSLNMLSNFLSTFFKSLVFYLPSSFSNSFNLPPGYKTPLTLQGMALGTFNFKPALFVAESLITPTSFASLSSSDNLIGSLTNLSSPSDSVLSINPLSPSISSSSVSNTLPYVSSRINVYGDCFESTSLRPYLSTIISSSNNEGASLPYSLSFDSVGNFYSSFLYSDSVLKFLANSFQPAPINENFQYISVNSNKNFNFSSSPSYIKESFQNLVQSPLILSELNEQMNEEDQDLMNKRNLRWREFKNTVRRRLIKLQDPLWDKKISISSHNESSHHHNNHSNSDSSHHIDFFPGTFVQFGIPIHPNITGESSFNSSTTRYYNPSTFSSGSPNTFHSSGGIRSITWVKNSTELWIAHEHLNLIVIVDDTSRFLDFINVASPRGLYHNEIDHPDNVFVSTRMKLTDIYPPGNSSTNVENEQQSFYSIYNKSIALKSLNLLITYFSNFLPSSILSFLHKKEFFISSNLLIPNSNEVNLQTSMNPKKKKIGIILKYDINTRKIVHYYQSIGMKRPGSIISYKDTLYVTDQTRNAVISFNITTTRVIQMVITPNNFEEEVVDHMILSSC